MDSRIIKQTEDKSRVVTDDNGGSLNDLDNVFGFEIHRRTISDLIGSDRAARLCRIPLAVLCRAECMVVELFALIIDDRQAEYLVVVEIAARSFSGNDDRSLEHIGVVGKKIVKKSLVCEIDECESFQLVFLILDGSNRVLQFLDRRFLACVIAHFKHLQFKI